MLSVAIHDGRQLQSLPAPNMPGVVICCGTWPSALADAPPGVAPVMVPTDPAGVLAAAAPKTPPVDAAPAGSVGRQEDEELAAPNKPCQAVMLR